MIPAPRPHDETARLRALRAHIDIQNARDDGVQAVAEMAARAVGVPIALVSLVDDTEQLFAGCVGLDAERTSRDVAFCAYTILSDDILEVRDARQDPRFVQNPLVTGPPYIRFYAGAPLTSAEGHRLGTLCLIDSHPRQLNTQQRQLLRDMAETASRVLRKLRQLNEANHQLVDALEDSRRTERATATFFASMSHELRTPLNAVIGFAEVIERESFGPISDSRYAEYAGDIRRSGEHLLSLINGILDISRLDAGQHILYPEELDLGAEVNWVLRMLQPLCESYGAEIQPAPGLDTLEVVFDKRAVRQLLLNLLSNAVKYAGGAGTITLQAEREDSQIQLCVVDQGPGMDADTTARLFEPFARAKRAHQDCEGTGLGLALCKKLVDFAGGEIEVDSVPGQGTRVEVMLPDLGDIEDNVATERSVAAR